MADTDSLDGLPDDLKRILRDPNVVIPRDQFVFEAIAKWTNAPCDTPSAWHPEYLKGFQVGYESGMRAAEKRALTGHRGCGCASPLECSGASDCEYRGVRVCPDCDEPDCPGEWTPDD